MISEKAKNMKGPYQIAIDVTNKCNYRCLHCYNASGENNTNDQELTDDELRKLIAEIGELKPQSVCFCGGEPLLRFDMLCEMADMLYSNGVNGIAMVSNGYYLTEEKARLLKEKHIHSVQISLDGYDSESCFALRQNALAFDKAVSAIQALKKAGYKNNVVACIPNKANYKNFDKIVELCMELDVSEIRCQPLMLIGRGALNVEKIALNQAEYIEFLRVFYRIQQNNKRIKLQWGDPVDHLIRFRENATNGFMPTMSIKANGNIMVSPYLPLAVGNVKKYKLKEYWESGYYNIWRSRLVDSMASSILCISDMQTEKEGRITWLDEDLEVDLINENDKFEWME